MRPGIAVSRYEVASMTDVAVIEVIVGSLDYVLQTNAHTHPPYEFLHSDAPLHNFS